MPVPMALFCQAAPSCTAPLGILADVEKGREQPWIEAGLREGRPLSQKADSIMAVQAFLVAGDHAEIADPRIRLGDDSQ